MGYAAASARSLARRESANRLPSLSAFAEATYANPNQRRFPQSEEWFPTWSAGAQVTWTLTDIVTAGANAAAMRARAGALTAEVELRRDQIELEVTRAYRDVTSADAAITTTGRLVESAEEAYRVARQSLGAGRTSPAALMEAEVDLGRARFEQLDAKIGARTARVRLDHALGRAAR